MKRYFIVLILICVTISGCNSLSKKNENPKEYDNKTNISSKEDDNTWLKKVKFEDYSADNPQSNSITGEVTESDRFIVFSDYVYDKKEKKTESLCKKPTCDHAINNINCILNKGTGYRQFYDGKILCTGEDSTKIYELDPQIGEIKEKYDTGMEYSLFSMIGKDIALLSTAEDDFYVVDLKSGKKAQIMKAKLYNAFFTIQGEYLYVSLENLSLHKVSLRGDGDTIIAEKAGRPIVYKNHVYYGYWQDENWNLRCVDTEGKDDHIVIEDMVMHTIYKDRIYYSTASYPRKMMMCKLDGSKKKKLDEGDANYYILPKSQKILISREMIKDDGMEYLIMNLDGTNMETLYSYKNQ